jgi:hypothetical protein
MVKTKKNKENGSTHFPDKCWEKITWIDLNGFILDAIRYKSGVISVRSLPIDENSIRHSKVVSSIKGRPQCLKFKIKIKK